MHIEDQNRRNNGAKTEGRDQRGRFAPGNPGKRHGSRHRATVLAQHLLEDGVEDAVRTILDAVRQGDLTAARVVVDKLVPAVKERPVSLALPELATASGIAEAQGAVMAAVANGELTPSEASTLSAVIENRRRAIETLELETRIAALEGRKQ